MQARLDYFSVAPELLSHMVKLEQAIRAAGLEQSLYELVKTRASQINGCGYCLHMHTTDARASGETEMRLYLLNAWRDSTLYTPRERAALAWTESLTRVSETGAPDADYQALEAHFSEHEKVALTLLITTINAWNRLAIGFRTPHPDTADTPRHRQP